MEKKAIIFDHDGTLVNSIPAVHYCTNEVLTAAGCPPIDEALTCTGMAYPTLERFSWHSGIKDRPVLEKMGRDFYELMNEEGVGMVSPYPGIREALEGLARGGFSLGILSNNQGMFLRRVAAVLEYSYDMGVILGEDDVPAPKPSPLGLRQACCGLGAAPERVWYVGDGAADFYTAQNAGVKSALVSWGTSSVEELEALGPREIFNSPQDMAVYFSALN